MTRVLVPTLITISLLLGSGSSIQQSDDSARRLLTQAERLEQDGNLEGALSSYQLLVDTFSRDPLADDALLRVAQLRWTLRDESGSRVAIDRLKTDYVETAGAAGAFVLDGNIRVDTATSPTDLQDAREEYRRVMSLYARADFPNLPPRPLAMLRAGEMSVLLGEPDTAAGLFLAAIEDESSGGWTAAQGRVHLASVLMRQGDWASAAEILQRAVDQADVDETFASTAAMARRRLALGYRLLLRPALGQQPWIGARQVPVPVAEIKNPVGIAAAEDNRLALVDEGIPLLAVLATDGSFSVRMPSSEARHPFFGFDGVAYAATKRSITMPQLRDSEQFSAPDGDEVKPVENVIAGARGIFRQWLVLDENKKRVGMFNESLQWQTFLTDEGDEPVDVAVDYLGRIYVLDRRAERVTRFAADGTTPLRLPQRDWRRPEAIAVDQLGNYYVLDRDAKKVEVFDAGGNFRWEVGPRLPGGIELRSPRDIGVDGSGRLYIADRDLKAFLVLE